MTSILIHQILQALIMLATSDICPPADWYADELHESGRVVVLDQCTIPLTTDMSETDVRAFYRSAKKLAGRRLAPRPG